MDVLVLTNPELDHDPAVHVGQSLARWTGGSWSALHAVGWGLGEFIGPIRRRRTGELADRLRWSADPEPPPVRHDVEFRSVAAAVRCALSRARPDVIVVHVPVASGNAGPEMLHEILGASRLPVLVVRRSMSAPPRRLVLVTEGRDLVRSVFADSLGFLEVLRTSEEFADAGRDPFEIDLVHAVRAEYEWTDARVLLAEQMEPSLDAGDFLLRSVRPALLGQLGTIVLERDPDLIGVFADVHGAAWSCPASVDG